MATIGLDRLYYAKITENDAGEETYGTPSQLAKAISADLSVELAEATLYADDGASEIVKEFKSGTLSLGIDDIGSAAAFDLTGATIDKNKVLISASEDGGDPVAVGFRAKKSNGKYKYYWLYRVKFGIPATNLATKGDSITFSTPTIEGTILRRNKADAGGKHPWKAEALEGDVTAATITNWYKEVYEPTYTTTPERTAVINIGDEEYTLLLTTKATKEIAGRYGGLENLGEKLMKSENFEMAIGEIVWLITLLANQSILIHNLKDKEHPKELLTEDVVELLTTPLDLAGYKTAITEALYKGTKRNVECEKDAKNAQVG